MKKQTIIMQKKGNRLVPVYQSDLDELKKVKDGRQVKITLDKSISPRSLKQLKLYWACIKQLVDNSENEEFMTINAVHLWLKIKLKFLDGFKKIGGVVFILLKSISYRNIDSEEATEYISNSIRLIAEELGVSVEELTKASEDKL